MGFEPILCLWQQTGYKCASLLAVFQVSVLLQILSVQTRSLNGVIRPLHGSVTFTAALPFMLRSDL